MIKHKLAIAFAGGLMSFGIGLPLSAQIEEPPAVLDESELEAIDNGGINPYDGIETDDNVGLPDGAESPPDAGLPDAGEVVPNGLIRIDVDGVPGYYSPVNVDETQLEGTDIPIYRLNRATGALEDAAVLENDDDDLVGNDADVLNNDSSGEFIIYPPADSIEDLEPEDILE